MLLKHDISIQLFYCFTHLALTEITTIDGALTTLQNDVGCINFVRYAGNPPSGYYINVIKSGG